MKVLFIALLLMVACLAQAHLYVGEYRGTTLDGKSCGFIIEEIKVHSDVIHPLNQELTINYQDELFYLKVKNSINPDSSKIVYDPAKLIGLRASNTGEKAFLLDLHPANHHKHHGPAHMLLLNKKYGSTVTEKVECLNIEYVY